MSVRAAADKGRVDWDTKAIQHEVIHINGEDVNFTN
jgi:hypothetical protein